MAFMIETVTGDIYQVDSIPLVMFLRRWISFRSHTGKKVRINIRNILCIREVPNLED